MPKPTINVTNSRFARFKDFPKVLDAIDTRKVTKTLYRLKWNGVYVEGYHGKYVFDSIGKAKLSFKRTIDWVATEIFTELGESELVHTRWHRISPEQLNEYVDYLIASGELVFEEFKPQS